MISSTYLRKLSLSHGAGDSFGLLFFAFYTLTLLVSPLWKVSWRPLMTSALASAFVGNVLMLLRELNLVPGGWTYAVVVSLTIGYGLATSELGWLDRLRSFEHAGGTRLSSSVPLAFLIGGVMAAFIFIAPGLVELPFALLSLAGSTAVVWKLPETPTPASDQLPDLRIGPLSPDDIPRLAKAVSYLAVFAFIFGAVSQMSVIDRQGTPFTEGQALLGIALAATAFYALSRMQGRTGNEMRTPEESYGLLVPVVGIALVALPFIESSPVGAIAAVLVFVAFYLTGINMRVVLSRLIPSESSIRTVGGAALGIGSLAVIAGVALGALALAGGDVFERLAFVSLVSMFVLVASPLLAQALFRQSKNVSDIGSAETSQSAGADRATDAPDGGSNVSEVDGNRLLAFAASCELTARETDVLKLICQGRSRPYIAQELGISPNTVKGYTHSIYQKCGAADKQDLLDKVHGLL